MGEQGSDPAGGTRHKRLFLTPSGYTSRPLREVPRERNASRQLDALRLATLRDEQDLVRQACTLRDEPECIDGASISTYTEAIRTREALARQQALAAVQALRPLLAPDARLKDAQRRAKQRHINLTGEFHVVSLLLDNAQRGGRKPPKNALTRLERIEAQLDGLPLAA